MPSNAHLTITTETLDEIVGFVKSQFPNKKFPRNLIRDNTVDYSEYHEWIWDNKIRPMCPMPFQFYINTGKFVGDEMRGQVLGIYRDRYDDGTYSRFFPMTKYDWYEMDEYAESIDRRHIYEECIRIWNPKYKFDAVKEHYIVNIEAMDWYECPEEYEGSEDDDIEEIIYNADRDVVEAVPVPKNRNNVITMTEPLFDDLLQNWTDRNIELSRGK